MTTKDEPKFQGSILIIDDSTTELCRIFLELEGFRVHIAENDQQGMTDIKEVLPDLILLDIMMPGMDGFQMLEHIKADPTIRNIPVLVHSVHSETTTVVKTLQMGASDFLKKPYDVDELIARAKKLIIFKQSQDALIAASAELIRNQHEIDAALEKWGREADAFKRQVEASVINLLAGTDVELKLDQAMTSSEQARRLINRIVDLSDHKLPEYHVLN